MSELGETVCAPAIRRQDANRVLLKAGLLVLVGSLQAGNLLAQDGERASSRPLAIFEDPGRTVLAVSFSSDGKVVATGGRSKWIQLRSIESGQVERAIACPVGGVADIAFSPDGKLLAVTYFQRVVQILDYHSGTTIHLFEVAEGHERRVAFSNDSRIFATAGRDKKVKLWDARSGELLRATPPQPYSASDVEFSPDGRTFATVTGAWLDYKKPGETKLWNIDSAREVALFEKHSLEIKGVFFDQKGKRLFTYGPGGMRIWDVETKEKVAHVGKNICFISAVLLPDQLHVATGTNDGKVDLWNSRSTRHVTRFSGHPELVQRVAVSPDGSLLVTSGKEGSVRFWATGQGTECGESGKSAAELVRAWPQQ